MLSVTVMMFKDIVESVTLLKDDAWNANPQIMLEKTNSKACPPLNLNISKVVKSKAECQYPLQTRRALFPAPPVTFQQPGGCALLRCTAEPANQNTKFRQGEGELPTLWWDTERK